jgi:hypothetical protein
LYSNEGSSLAALIVERITKMPYDQYVKENISKSLNIDTRKTGIRLADFENTEELVNHYAYASNASFLDLWHQEIPYLNITQMPVGLSVYLMKFLNYRFKIFHHGHMFHFLVSVVIQQVFGGYRLVLYLSFFESLSIMDLHYLLLNLLRK